MRCLSVPRIQIHIDAGRGRRLPTAESGSARGFFLLKAVLLSSLSPGAARGEMLFVCKQVIHRVLLVSAQFGKCCDDFRSSF